ncbi:MAG: PH domain-containing protein [Spirosomataceae bacterium]
MHTNNVLFKAEFNPLIKPYLLLYVSFFFLISVIGIALLPIWFLGVGQWWSNHYFHKLECELSERSLRFKKGILVQVEKTIPLENIQDITFIEGPLLRAFHLCILKLETAGQSAHGANNMEFIGIMNAPEFRNMVLTQREKLVQELKGSPQQVDNEQVLLLREIRDTLVKIQEGITKEK